LQTNKQTNKKRAKRKKEKKEKKEKKRKKEETILGAVLVGVQSEED